MPVIFMCQVPGVWHPLGRCLGCVLLGSLFKIQQEGGGAMRKSGTPLLRIEPTANAVGSRSAGKPRGTPRPRVFCG